MTSFREHLDTLTYSAGNPGINLRRLLGRTEAELPELSWDELLAFVQHKPEQLKMFYKSAPVRYRRRAGKSV